MHMRSLNAFILALSAAACADEPSLAASPFADPAEAAALPVALPAPWASALPDARLEPQLVLVSGRDVISLRWLHGTHAGPLAAPTGVVPPSGKRVGLLALHHAHVGAGGRVLHEGLIFDEPTLFAQLGLSEGPARPVITSGVATPRIVVASGDAREHHNAELVRRAYRLWNGRNPAFDGLLADDIVESNNSEPEDSVGKAALQAHNAGLIAAFPDARVEVQHVWAAGDFTVGRERLCGTHLGALGPLPASGRAIDVLIVEIIEWRDGRAIRSWPFLNGRELANQLGL